MRRVLIVEDELKIRAFVVPYLLQEGFEADEADDGEQGLAMALSGRYDLVLLDVMLPKLDGWTICRELRKKSRVPVLMLTAKAEESDIVSGFEAGADDYLSKPFSPRELMARVKALMARSYPEEKRFFSFGPVSVDSESQEAFLNEKPLALTPKEFDILLLFVQNPNKTFTREQLLSRVWGYEFFGDSRTVDTHVKQLREKLDPYRGLIITVWGKGYKLGEEQA